MKMVLAASLAVLLLTGNASSLAATTTYTDTDSGFKLKAHPSWMEICGKNFYGLADKPDKKEAALNLVCAFTAKEIEKSTGKKFTTREFLSKYKDLQVLERNGIPPGKVNYLFFMPDPYEIKENNRLSLFPKELIEQSDISISTNKKERQPFVYLHLMGNNDKNALKKLSRAVDMQVALTSQNDMLYAVVSTFPLPDLKAQKAKIEDATPFSKKRVRRELADSNKEKISSFLASRKSFIKGLSFFKPGKATEAYGFNDALLGGRVKLPENWAYVQVNDDTLYEKIPLKLTLAVPWNGVSELLSYKKHADLALGEGDISGLNFQKISDFAIFASSKTKDKGTFAKLFDSPVLTGLLVDKLVKERLRQPWVKKFADFKKIRTKSMFNDTSGTIRLFARGSVNTDNNFNVFANLMFTPQNFGMATYVVRDGIRINQKLKKNLEQISLIRK